MLNSNHIRRRFEHAANTFDSADFVHAATRDGLFQRLQPLLVDAHLVVDLGSATGAANKPLNKRFPKAQVISVDVAHNMLQKARNRKSWLAKTSFAQANAAALPFANESVDVVFSNQLLPWIAETGTVFTEVARVLRKGGMFAFATLGPDSLREISRAWSQVDDNAHVSQFPDMHNLGDALVNAGLRDPVLDVDRLGINYKDSHALFADLTAVGARNALFRRVQSLTGKQRFANMVRALEDTAVGGEITLELELVFGHCWGAGPKMDRANYRIDATQIPVRRS